MISKVKIPKLHFEKKAWSEGFFTLGIDEAGRGCLAGPMVVGAAVIPQNTFQPLLKDSKVLTEAERNEAFAWITKHCWWSVALANHRTIDQHNIYQTTLRSMKRAYLQLIGKLPFELTQLKYVLIDAMPLDVELTCKHKKLEFLHFNYGETVSPSIAAASIVAKVTRDRIMERLAGSFPQYQFEKHKAYGTADHLAAIQTVGPSIIHRTTFLKNIVKEDEHHAQTKLFC